MSRTNLPIVALVNETVSAHSAGTAIVHASGAEIAAGGNTGKLLIRIEHTTNAQKTATIKAPTDNPAAPRAPLGDLTITMAAGNTTVQRHAIVIESARFAQTDGKILIDFAADTTGNIWVWRLPRGA